MEIDRVVLDANVFISAIIKKKADKLLLLPSKHNVIINTCPELIEEIARNLREPHLIKYLNQPVDDILEYIEEITHKVQIEKRFDRALDINDNYLFDLSYSVKSYFLVTGDRLLLGMKQVNKIRIISPSAFYYLLGEKW
jgi:putative PIN family toxin of toxin-antitoxin system